MSNTHGEWLDRIRGHGKMGEMILKRADNSDYKMIKSVEEPERKKGKWIKNEEESAKHVEAIYVCSACHNFEAWGETEKYKFCPNCGADMRGEEDGFVCVCTD